MSANAKYPMAHAETRRRGETVYTSPMNVCRYAIFFISHRGAQRTQRARTNVCQSVVIDECIPMRYLYGSRGDAESAET